MDLGKRSAGVRDDLFNWILAQARSKEQHALSVEDFRRIFDVTMPRLEPDSFSQPALLLFQELFKIYKYSSEGSEATATSGAIEYVWKLAFRSANREVGISAIQFLNNHYIHSPDAGASVENETRFVELCMGYLDEALGALGERREMSLATIERGLLLLRNHLDAFQRRNSYQLRLLQLNDPEARLLSHLKAHQQTRATSDSATSLFKLVNSLVAAHSDTRNVALNYTAFNPLHNIVTLVCHLNQAQFKFALRLSLNETVGDLKAVLREIIVRTLRSSALAEDGHEPSIPSFAFFNNKLTVRNSKTGRDCVPQSSELVNFFKASMDSEEEFAVKIFCNGGEITSTSLAAAALLDAKLLAELGLKVNQLRQSNKKTFVFIVAIVQAWLRVEATQELEIGLKSINIEG